MKVSITKSDKKRKYEYRTITLFTQLKDWEIAPTWGNFGAGYDVKMNKGKIQITVRRNHLE